MTFAALAGRTTIAVILLGLARLAAAGGPLLDVSEPIVPAGEPVRLTVLGEPGHAFLVAASTEGAGLALHQLPLELGPDAVLVGQGRLDATGRVAGGSYSVAMGRSAKVAADHHGSFLFADQLLTDLASAAANEFAVRARGGVRFVLDVTGAGSPTWTCAVVNGGSCACSSDRALKENLAPVDAQAVLARLSTVPIYHWTARGADPAVRHLGPTAQDFHAAFGLGDRDTHLATGDVDGVVLAAIQALHALSLALDARTAQLDARSRKLEARAAALDAATRTEGPGGAWLAATGAAPRGAER